jgi:hypothetical protein
MILIDENEYSMLKKTPWKQLPDDRLKTGLYDKSKVDLGSVVIPDDIKAKQLQHDFIRFQLAQLKLPDYTPLPTIPELSELQDLKPVVEKKKIRKSKREVKRTAKWEAMN